jgi:hypothetical protein
MNSTGAARPKARRECLTVNDVAEGGVHDRPAAGGDFQSGPAPQLRVRAGVPI